jgi:hypothetical protein
MNNLAKLDLVHVRGAGMPFNGLPEDPPRRDGHTLFAVITNDNALTFAIAVDNPDDYRVYRTKTRRTGDHGSWIFQKMKLFFVPDNLLHPENN